MNGVWTYKANLLQTDVKKKEKTFYFWPLGQNITLITGINILPCRIETCSNIYIVLGCLYQYEAVLGCPTLVSLLR